MIEMNMITCDLCGMDGQENIEAIGWYKADDGKIYDVCKKHAKDVKNAGKVINKYYKPGRYK